MRTDLDCSKILVASALCRFVKSLRYQTMQLDCDKYLRVNLEVLYRQCELFVLYNYCLVLISLYYFVRLCMFATFCHINLSGAEFLSTTKQCEGAYVYTASAYFGFHMMLN